MAEMVSVSRAKVREAIEAEVSAILVRLPPEIDEAGRLRVENSVRNALWLEWANPDLHAEISARLETPRG